MTDDDPKTKSKTSATKKAAKPHPLDEEAFAKFWGHYPRKVGKADAVKAFAKLAPSPELLTTILAALELQSRSRNWTKDRGQFFPHPATWLNGRRWEDEGTALPKPVSRETDYDVMPGKPYVPTIAPMMGTNYKPGEAPTLAERMAQPVEDF